MSILEAIILGIIQGLSEFIPISSTAHLTIAGHLLGLIDPDNPEKWTAFIAVIQLGTLAAVLLYFSKELRTVPFAFLKENFAEKKKFGDQSESSRLGWLVIAGSIPIVIVGLLFKDIIESSITKDPYVIGASLIGLALILGLAELLANFKRDMKHLNMKDAAIVGLAQCVALIPGSSRSGTTITAGLFLGLRRDTAARFSFLLSIPAVLGSGLFEFYQSLEYLSADMMINLLVATLFSAVSGYASIAFLLRYLKKRSTLLFIIYRVLIGLAVILMALNGLL